MVLCMKHGIAPAPGQCRCGGCTAMAARAGAAASRQEQAVAARSEAICLRSCSAPWGSLHAETHSCLLAGNAGCMISRQGYFQLTEVAGLFYQTAPEAGIQLP